MHHQKGFTLVELVVVIVILGILAATALPRFVNLTQDARVAGVNGMAGGLNAAVSVVQARYMATGNMAATTVAVTGGTVTVLANSGIPVAAAGGIDTAIQSTDGFTVAYPTATTATFRPNNGGGANCGVTYDEATGRAAADTSAC